MLLRDSYFWYTGVGVYLKPNRAGEKTRKCIVCGGEYVPQSRTQKYCKVCRNAVNKGDTHA